MQRRKKKQKGKGIAVTINLVAFPFDVMVSIGQSDDEFYHTIVKHLPANCIDDFKRDNSILNFKETQHGRCIHTSTGHTLIRLREFPSTPIQKGYLAHEVFHAVSFILDRIGFKLCLGKSDEAYAYLIDYITAQVYSSI